MVKEYIKSPLFIPELLTIMYPLRLVLQALNNREIASLAWGIPCFTAFLMKKEVRSGVLDVACMLVTPKIILPLIAFLTYVTAVVGILAEIGFWTPVLLKSTIFWFVAAGVVFFFKSGEAVDDPRGFFSKMTKNMFGLAVLLSALVGLYAFSLTVEYFFVPFVTFVAVVQQITSVEDDHLVVHRLFTGIAAAIGFVLMGFTVHWIIIGPGGTSTLQLRSLALPTILSLSVIPFLYLLAVFMAYDTIYRMTKDEFQGRTRLPWLIWWKTINGCHLNLRKLNIMRTKGVFWLSGVETEGEVREVLQELGVVEQQDVASKKSEPEVGSDVRHGLTKEERKTVWKQLVAAEDRAEVEGGIRYPLSLEDVGPGFVFENERKIVLDKSDKKEVPPGSRIEVSERNESDMLYVKAYEENQLLCEGWIGLSWLYNQDLKLFDKNLELNREYRDQLQQKYEREIFERFGIDKEMELSITHEAIENNWKTPEPLTVTEYLEDTR